MLLNIAYVIWKHAYIYKMEDKKTNNTFFKGISVLK
jgi:hypothetical protein